MPDHATDARVGNEPKVCPSCAHRSPWYYTHCGLCGNGLRDDEQATSTRVPEMRRRIRFISTDREQERVKESRSAGMPRTCVHTMADAIEEYVNGCGDTWYTDDAIEAALRAARAAGFIEDARE